MQRAKALKLSHAGSLLLGLHCFQSLDPTVLFVPSQQNAYEDTFSGMKKFNTVIFCRNSPHDYLLNFFFLEHRVITVDIHFELEKFV